MSQPQCGHFQFSHSRKFNKFQLFNDEDVDVIGTQILQNVEDSRDMSIRGEAEDTLRKNKCYWQEEEKQDNNFKIKRNTEKIKK